jgi:hypothetical protein
MFVEYMDPRKAIHSPNVSPVRAIVDVAAVCEIGVFDGIREREARLK